MQITKSSFYQIIVFHFFFIAYFVTLPYKDDWRLALLLITTVIILALLEYKRTVNIMSPLLLWYLFWLGAITIGRMNLDLYPFYRTWEAALIRLVLTNTYIFFWFFWAGEYTVKERDRRVTEELEEYNYPGISCITSIMLALALLCFTANVVMTGVVPQLSGDANVYREAFVQTKLYKVVNILRVSFAFVPIAYRFEKDIRKKKCIAALTLLLFIAEMLSGWRTYTFQAMILLLSSLFAVSPSAKSNTVRKKNNRILILFAVMGIVFIGYIAVTRDKVTGPIREKIEYLLYTLYMYVSPNFLNLQSAVEEVVPVNVPVYSTEAVWGFFLNRDATLLKYGEIDQTIGAFNVSTYMLQPWGDFGSIGTCFCSAFIAIVAGAVFKKTRAYGGITTAVLLGIMNITVFVMHNNLFLRTKTIILWIAAAKFAEIVIKRKKERQNESALPG